MASDAVEKVKAAIGKVVDRSGAHGIGNNCASARPCGHSWAPTTDHRLRAHAGTLLPVSIVWSMDPFDVFDAPPPSVDKPRDVDPFDVFDAAPPNEVASNKKLRPSPVLPLVRHFVSQHATTTCADLSDAGATELATLLSCAAELASSDELERCRDAASRAADRAWADLHNEPIRHAPLSREAYVISQAILCLVMPWNSFCWTCLMRPGMLLCPRRPRQPDPHQSSPRRSKREECH